MKYLFTLMLSALIFQGFAQPVITSNNFQNPWRKIINAVDFAPSSSVTPGSNGNNQTWDYSTLITAKDYDTIQHSPIHVDPDFASYPEATGVYFSSYDSSKTYYQLTSTGLYFIEEGMLMGQSGGNMKMKILSFPFTYGTIAKDSTAIKSAFANDDTSSALPFDSIRITGMVRTTSTGVGTGTLKVPGLTFPKTVKVKVDFDMDLTFEVRLKVTKSWIDASSFIPSESLNTSSYYFLDENHQDFVMTMSLDTLGAVEEVRYRVGSNLAVNPIPQIAGKVFPNPTSQFVNVEVDGTSDFTLTDLQGRQVLSTQVSNSQQVDVSNLPKGFYLYTLTRGEERSFGRLQVQ